MSLVQIQRLPSLFDFHVPSVRIGVAPRLAHWDLAQVEDLITPHDGPPEEVLRARLKYLSWVAPGSPAQRVLIYLER